MNRERERERANKDWTGDQRSIYSTLGASNHTNHDRQQHIILQMTERKQQYLKIKL